MLCRWGAVENTWPGASVPLWQGAATEFGVALLRCCGSNRLALAFLYLPLCCRCMCCLTDLATSAQLMLSSARPSLPQFLGLCQLPPALVTEYCARGSLYSCLQAARANSAAAAELTWARRLSMVRGACGQEGLE